MGKQISFQCPYKEISCIAVDTSGCLPTTSCDQCHIYKENVGVEKNESNPVISNGRISEEFEKDKRVAEVAISAALINFISKYQIRNFTLNTDSFSVSTDERGYALSVFIEIN